MKILNVLYCMLLLACLTGIVSASNELTFSDTRYEYSSITYPYYSNSNTNPNGLMIYFDDNKPIADISTIFFRPSSQATNFLLYDDSIRSQTVPVTFHSGTTTGAIVGYGTFTYFKGDTTAQSHVRIDFSSFNREALTHHSIALTFDETPTNLQTVYGKSEAGHANIYLRGATNTLFSGTQTIEYTSRFINQFELSDYNTLNYRIDYTRGSVGYDSSIIIKDKNYDVIFENSGSTSSNVIVLKTGEPFIIQVYSTVYQKWFTGILGEGYIDPSVLAQPVTVNFKEYTTGSTITPVYMSITNTDTEEQVYASIHTSGQTVDLPLGNYRIYIEKTGYTTDEEFTWVTVGPSTTTITLQMNEIIGNMPIPIAIEDLNTGSQLSGVTVKIYNAVTNTIVQNVVINSNDTVMLSPGQYYVDLQKSGYNSVFPKEDNRISVVDAQSTGHFWMTKEITVGESSVIINVFDETTGELIPNCILKLYDGQTLLSATTLPTGSAQFYLIDGKTYRAEVTNLNYLNSPISKTFIVFGDTNIVKIYLQPKISPNNANVEFRAVDYATGALLYDTACNIHNLETGIWNNITMVYGSSQVSLTYDHRYEVYLEKSGYAFAINPYHVIHRPDTVPIWEFYATTGALPVGGNVTLQITTKDTYGNIIPGADILITGNYGLGNMTYETVKTNNNGYASLEVIGLSGYDILAFKIGYKSATVTLNVAENTRQSVQMVMIPEVPYTPTIPTPTPSETPGTGFMEESGQAMATFFGVPLTIGKMILGMLIALAIGMATAKQLKGGAQEFGIGLLGGAMLGVVVGLIPTWVIVVLLLTVGLYIGKMYMSGDAGGR